MPGPAALAPILVISFLYSLGTAVLWNGLAFVAKEHYGFAESANLALAVYNGALYAIGAFASGPLLRRLDKRIATRNVIIIVMLLQVALCPLVLLSSSVLVLFLVTGGMSLLAAVFWPITEAYLSAGRDPKRMSSAIGWWNIIWMTALGLGLVAMAPFLATGNAQWSIAMLAPINLICVVIALIGIPAHVAEHHAYQPDHAPPAGYRGLLSSNRALLPTSYALMGALSPIMPYILDRLDAPLEWQTPLTATWMFFRVIGIALLWAIPFWHGRWSTVLLGALLLLSGFTTTVLGESLWAVVLGLALFGLGHAIIYYAALYYAMALGNAEVDAAGTHEGLIGVGYAAGPCTALAGVVFGGGGWIVLASFIVPAMAIWPATRPYLANKARAAWKRP